MKKKIKVTTTMALVSCVALSSTGCSLMSANLDMVEVVEAKSADYVEPYEETEVEGVSNTQSEVLEDNESELNTIGAEIETEAVEINNEELVVEESSEQQEEVETVEETENLADQPVQIEYISRSEFIGEVPNEMNDIIIAMYHGVSADVLDSDTVHRSIEGFKADLQLLYDNGYRAITMEDLMSNNINVPKGYTPIVLTFDDGLSSQLSFEYDANGELSVKENTAVAIINEFNEKNPDFGQTAMFYVYTSQRPFKGKGTFEDCLEYLLANGYEVGAHTYSHPFLDRLTAGEIQMEMAYNTTGITKNMEDLDALDIKYVAYPYGVTPDDEERRQYLLRGYYQGYAYEFHSAVLAAPNLNTSTLIYSNSYDSANIGRYRGTDNAVLDLSWKVRRDERVEGNKFISDGDPNMVTILEKDFSKVNLETLNGKKLRVVTD